MNTLVNMNTITCGGLLWAGVCIGSGVEWAVELALNRCICVRVCVGM